MRRSCRTLAGGMDSITAADGLADQALVPAWMTCSGDAPMVKPNGEPTTRRSEDLLVRQMKPAYLRDDVVALGHLRALP